MPYIIETTTPDPANAKDYGRIGDSTPGAPSAMSAVRGCWPPRVTRTAAATLEEVNAAVRAECERVGGAPRTVWTDPAIYNRSLHTGGTIGPLPDGTVIEVRHVERFELGFAAGLIAADHPQLWDDADLVAKFNRAGRFAGDPA